MGRTVSMKDSDRGGVYREAERKNKMNIDKKNIEEYIEKVGQEDALEIADAIYAAAHKQSDENETLFLDIPRADGSVWTVPLIGEFSAFGDDDTERHYVAVISPDDDSLVLPFRYELVDENHVAYFEMEDETEYDLCLKALDAMIQAVANGEDGLDGLETVKTAIHETANTRNRQTADSQGSV